MVSVDSPGLQCYSGFDPVSLNRSDEATCSGCAVGRATRVCRKFDQGSWALVRSTLAIHHSSPATKIEGPGVAWAFVLSGASRASKSL